MPSSIIIIGVPQYPHTKWTLTIIKTLSVWLEYHTIHLYVIANARSHIARHIHV